MSRRGWLLLGAFVAPLAIRTLWFYQGGYTRREPVASPDYTALRQASPPLGAAVSPAPPSPSADRVVLVDWAHQNRFDVTELEMLGAALGALGARFEVVSAGYDFSALPLEERLKYAAAYVVAAPTQEFTTSEVQAVTRFVERGGRLLVISDPTRGSAFFDIFGFYGGPALGDVAAANVLLAPHDLAFSEDYLYNLRRSEGNFRNVFLADFADLPITQGLNEVALYGARSVRTRSGAPVLVGDGYTYSSRTDRGGDLAAAALSPQGDALALGDLTFLTPPYHEVADNGRFILNLADFLLRGERLRGLEDFPYLFTQNVEIVESEALPLSADHLLALAAAQDALGPLGRQVRISAAASEGLDHVEFALFDSAEDVQTTLEALGVVLPADSDENKLTLPGFPPFDPTGVGVLLVSHDEDGTTLIIMAETDADLQSTFDLVTRRDLSPCFVVGAAAICQVGAADFGFEPNFDFTEPDITDFGTDLFLPTPTPFPIPTP